jgi:hypothetical protein
LESGIKPGLVFRGQTVKIFVSCMVEQYSHGYLIIPCVFLNGLALMIQI